MKKLYQTLCCLSIFATSIYGQTELQASSKVIVDDGYDHAELSVTEWGGSHGLFFGSKINYTGTEHLWANGNAVFAGPSGQYGYGAFSMGYIANGGTFGFYDGGQSTGANNPINWNPVMTMVRGGNIGIGTTSPGSYRLAVEGTIGARKVKVTQLPWADFVFEDQYKLRPLPELEAYIKKNKHLPEVPTEKEVQANGIDLGDNQALLLQKIEELTLYVIQLQKEIETMKSEMKSNKTVKKH